MNTSVSKHEAGNGISRRLLSLAILLLPLIPIESAYTLAYQPNNVHSASRKLPQDLRRILVLPVTSNGSYEATEGVDMLYDLLVEELNSTKKFEVIRVTPAQLSAKTGRPSWQAEEALPETLLDTLGTSFACNGILFCQVTTFRAYAPLAIGWRFKLVDARDGGIIWAADEVFDAGRTSVQTGVKSFDRQRQRTGRSDDGWVTLHSPRRFGHYSAATLLQLLPER